MAKSSNAAGIANVLGNPTAFRSTDESRKKLGPAGERALDKAQQHKGKVIGDWKRRTGRTKSFGGLCPAGCYWPF